MSKTSSGRSAAPTYSPADRPAERTGAGPGAPPRERLVSLDVFRGMTVAGMLLVNNPGSWAHIFPPLAHAAWHGWTPTDLVFPFFLFIAGITTSLSLTARRARGDDEGAIVRQILRRGALIFLFGLLVNWFPGFTWGEVPGVADPTFLQRVVDRLHQLRLLGVLQRIALAYTAAALITTRTTLRQQVAIVAALLVGYWVAIAALPVPDHGLPGYLVLDQPARTMAAWVDRLVLDWGPLGNHIWVSSKTWDPEGVLSTVPAIGTAMLGVMAGRWIGQPRPLPERLAGLFAAGSLGMVAGLVWSWALPINKSLWTSSYVVFTAAMAAVALATVMWVVDVHRVRRWTPPFLAFGVNPTIAFVGSGVLARIIYSIVKVEYGGARVPLQAAIHQSLFASWLPPRVASLAFALSFVLLFLAGLGVLYRRNIIFKV
ncbi:MAG: N-acetylglucosamine related transporter, NagX [uncultured Gemmatimonadaceae bacterium]|uniref:N-acetylglucosamine related transporter, NagX n=1 Tax=uncultured Gemmatimonadaceae bacterium TaxID=246130 RepID=A0A6J4MGJ4_9BACT|nr:MAG: N-acetylglucosamine related transporter, NagX [uncultured Gemmatimonadaceae bacterium]